MSQHDQADGTPYIHPRLVELLELAFPDRCPKVGSSAEEVNIKQGEIRVVAWMRQRLTEQEN